MTGRPDRHAERQTAAILIFVVALLATALASPPVSDLQTLASLFRTGCDIGTPILASLEHQAELLRERTRERRQKAINRKMTQAMVPLVLFNFPMMLIIVFYPPVLEFSRLLFISS